MGKPSEQWRDDPEGKPESTVSKAVRQTAKLASQVTKLVVKQSGLVDEETAEIVGGVADAVQNQAEAGRDASIADRLKMAGWYIGMSQLAYDLMCSWIYEHYDHSYHHCY